MVKFYQTLDGKGSIFERWKKLLTQATYYHFDLYADQTGPLVNTPSAYHVEEKDP